MSQFFKETAVNKTDLKKYHENYERIFGVKQSKNDGLPTQKGKRMSEEVLVKEVWHKGKSPETWLMVKDIAPHFEKLEAQLKDANEVIGFYLNKNSYSSDCGKRAREYRAKYPD